jgi:hypothetical protein
MKHEINKPLQPAFQRFGMGGLFTPTCTKDVKGAFFINISSLMRGQLVWKV